MTNLRNPMADYGYGDAKGLVGKFQQIDGQIDKNNADILGTGAEGIEELKKAVTDNNDKTGVLVFIKKANELISQLQTRLEQVEKESGVVVADSPSAVADAQPNSNIVLTSDEAIQAMTDGKVFKTITIVGGNSDSEIKAVATDNLTVDGLTINGGKGATNGRVLISSNDVTIKNTTIEGGSTAYNIFESSQNINAPQYFTKSYNVDGLNVDNTELNHNVINIYTFENDANIVIKNSYFNLDVDKSNAIRLANYNNATGVTVTIENVDWTYENAEGNDWEYAGLVLYQPATSDKMLTGDTSAFKTWKFNFINCTYNGQKVDSINFGQHSQIFYVYNFNKTGQVSNPADYEGLTINFS